MTGLALTIWAVTLAIVAIVIVPLALSLLSRALTAARNIEAYIKSRLTTAVAEGLNNKIKVLKRMGYGYSNPTSFCRKILQRCGYLNHLSINTDEFFYKWPAPR